MTNCEQLPRARQRLGGARVRDPQQRCHETRVGITRRIAMFSAPSGDWRDQREGARNHTDAPRIETLLRITNPRSGPGRRPNFL